MGGSFGIGLSLKKDNTVVVYKEALPEYMKEEVFAGVKPYIASERNYDGIQYETLRRKIDPMFNQAHDALSAAYYEGYEFIWQGKNYGILDKDTFDTMQGKIWAEYEVMFHEENLKQEEKDIIPEEKYNKIEEYDEDGNFIKIQYKDKEAKERIKEYEKEGIDIKL